jgi:hypothetical protein
VPDTTEIETIQQKRLEIERRILSRRSQLYRNKMGQFATPPELARGIVGITKRYLPTNLRIRFLDPAFGTGSFFGALLEVFGASRVAMAVGYEVDPVLGRTAAELWSSTKLDLRVRDFTRVPGPRNDNEKPNLIICNPPYVRHHHLTPGRKRRLQETAKAVTGIEFNGLSGLYCHFIALSHAWMANGTLAAWLIPGEFLNVNHCAKLREYLLKRVKLLRIHLFEASDLQFEDARVSSAVVWFEGKQPQAGNKVMFSFGGSLRTPKFTREVPIRRLREETKWSELFMIREKDASGRNGRTLSDLFRISRGVATGANGFFILNEDDAKKKGIPAKFLVPILPPPRKLHVNEVRANAKGCPHLEDQLFLLSCDLPEGIVKKSYPNVWKYLKEGETARINKRYLCKNRSPWYIQEKRDTPLFLFTYMGRRNVLTGKTMRFIWNRSRAIATNSYFILYPKPLLSGIIRSKPQMQRKVWMALNMISTTDILAQGRVYGGGLHKLEPSEVGRVPAEEVCKEFDIEITKSA